MAQSGKQTLLQRLEGKDPFSDSVVDDHSERSEIIAPYLPPSNHQVWDRIQLQVGVSRSVPASQSKSNSSNGSSNSKAVDFAVVLINPRHDPVRLRAYLNETIRALLHLQGHKDMEEEEDDVAEKRNGDTAPVCLCLLLNFRDLESSSGQWMQESDVQALTMEVLQNYSSLEPSRLVLQCGSTSLFNCYGLNVLHHFIYQCYLQRKRCDLEQFLDDVGQAQYSTRKAPSVSYEEFLGIAQPSESKSPDKKKGKGKKAKKERKRDGASRKSSSKRAVIRDDEEVDPGHGSEDDSVETNSDSQTGRRRIMPNKGGARDAKAGAQSNGSSSRKEGKSFVSTKEALEAFLASEDENENNGSPPKALDRDDESENEDDDYFYDESGRRRKMEPTVEGAPDKQSGKIAKDKVDPGRGGLSDEKGRGGGKSGSKSTVQTAEKNVAEAIPKDDGANGGQEKKGEVATRRTSPMTTSEIENGSDAEDEGETGSKDSMNAKHAKDGGRVEPAGSDTPEELSGEKAKPSESSIEAIEDASEHDESAGSERSSSTTVEAKKPEVENGNHMSTLKDEKVLSKKSGDDANSAGTPTPALDGKGDSQRDNGDLDSEDSLVMSRGDEGGESEESKGGVTEDSLVPASSDTGDESYSGNDSLVADEILASDNDEHANPKELAAAKEATVMPERDENEERATKESPLPTSSGANEESDSGGSDFFIDQMRADENDVHVDPEELAAKVTLATVGDDESQDGITKESPLSTSSGANDESDSEGDFVVEEMRADDTDDHVDSEEVIVKGPPVTVGSNRLDDSDSDDSDFVINEIPSADETNGTDERDEENLSSQSDNVKARDRYQEQQQETITATSSSDEVHDEDMDTEKLTPSQQSALAREGEDEVSKENTSAKSSLVLDNKGEGESSIGNATAKGFSKSRFHPPQTRESISDTRAVAEPSSGLSAAARAAIAAAQLDFERMVQEPDHEGVAAKQPKKKKKESKDGEKKKKKKDKKAKRSEDEP
jgi:hypothetical protein